MVNRSDSHLNRHNMVNRSDMIFINTITSPPVQLQQSNTSKQGQAENEGGGGERGDRQTDRQTENMNERKTEDGMNRLYCTRVMEQTRVVLHPALTND